MKHRIAATVAAAVLAVGIASPAVAAPLPPNPNTPVIPSTPITPNNPFGRGIPSPRVPLVPNFFRNATVTLPTCKAIASARIFSLSTYHFTLIGDTSNLAAHTGYGTELASTHAIIEDGGYSCTFLVDGTKNQLIISVAPISPYDRSYVLARYFDTFGSTPSSIGGENVYLGGLSTSWHEVSFLLEDGAWVSGKVHSDGDFFPAVLQDVSDLVYELNH